MQGKQIYMYGLHTHTYTHHTERERERMRERALDKSLTDDSDSSNETLTMFLCQINTNPLTAMFTSLITVRRSGPYLSVSELPVAYVL